jgi:hypothetical protein
LNGFGWGDSGNVVERTCLHCALARALRAETATLAARGLLLHFERTEPVWLPVSGMRLYRGVRRLLRQAVVHGQPGTVKLVVLTLTGKSHVEVTATVPGPDGARVFAVAFPRYVPGTLARGFAEGIASS